MYSIYEWIFGDPTHAAVFTGILIGFLFFLAAQLLLLPSLVKRIVKDTLYELKARIEIFNVQDADVPADAVRITPLPTTPTAKPTRTPPTPRKAPTDAARLPDKPLAQNRDTITRAIEINGWTETMNANGSGRAPALTDFESGIHIGTFMAGVKAFNFRYTHHINKNKNVFKEGAFVGYETLLGDNFVRIIIPRTKTMDIHDLTTYLTARDGGVWTDSATVDEFFAATGTAPF